MSGVEAEKEFSHALTKYEHQEILDFKEVYYLGKLEAKQGQIESKENFGFDDEEGNYLMASEDHLDYRYEIRRLLGRGSFGQVAECFDHKRKILVAVKVVTSSSKFRKQSKVEVAILEFLNRSSQSEHIVRMKACFSFRRHICIVFELLSLNLHQLIKSNKYRGFSPAKIKQITGQLVSALVTLRTYGVAHCDLKPENVILADNTQGLFKLIDFGSSCFEDQTVYSYIQSRYYRAPEVILGVSYGCPIDMWSLGCIVAEMVNGTPILAGDSEADHLLAIMEVLGLPPQELLAGSVHQSRYFKTFTEPIIKPNRQGYMRLPGSSDLATAVKTSSPNLLDFIRRCLTWDSKTRLTPEEAALHIWLQEGSLI
jgi:dual specificity tyrosine-phosphorylation-regulated kinase 2/3/4